jgi:carbon-monoxide dehydrogenase small subunit
MHVTCWLNGQRTAFDVPSNELLLDTLRDRAGLTGAKRSCDAQVCGACTVAVDGLALSACTTLTAEVDGATVDTIEGVATDGELSPVQQAFVEAGAFQCGFCTPGMIMMVESLLRDEPAADDADAASYLKGTLCRCTGYVKILEAVRRARATTGEVAP